MRLVLDDVRSVRDASPRHLGHQRGEFSADFGVILSTKRDQGTAMGQIRQAPHLFMGQDEKDLFAGVIRQRAQGYFTMSIKLFAVMARTSAIAIKQAIGPFECDTAKRCKLGSQMRPL